MREEFLPIEEEKKLVNQPNKLIKYFWSHYEEHLSGKLCWVIIIILIALNISLIIYSIIYLIINPISYWDLIYFIPLILFGIILPILFRKMYISEFQVYHWYSLIFLAFGGLAIIYTLLHLLVKNIYLPYLDIYFSFPYLASIGTYLFITLIIFGLYVGHRRILGAGTLHMYGIKILVNPNDANNWNYFIKGWDDWFGECLGVRIENYNQILNNVYNRLVFDSSNLKREISDTFNQEFFDTIKNHENPENLFKISESIKKLSNSQIKFELQTSILKIKRKLNTLELLSILVGTISGFIGTLISLMGLL